MPPATSSPATTSFALSAPVAPSTLISSVMRTDGRPGGNRTPNLRFWRPPLCQLSYWPTFTGEKSPTALFARPYFVGRRQKTWFLPATSETLLASAANKKRGFCSLPCLDGAKRRKTRNPLLALSYFVIFATTPAPTVLPPSRMAKRRPSSIAIGLISSTCILMLSPGMTISTPSGSCTRPVTSVVRK